MATQRQPEFITPEEYLESQRTAEVRSEYISGEMYEMSAASKEHSQILHALSVEVGNALKNKPCEGGVALAVRARASYLVPDLVIYCDGGDFTDQDEVLHDPVVIFEVLSPSTADFDHGHKWILYQQLPSLKHYVMIAQDRPHVEIYSRESENGWHYEAFSSPDVVIRLPYVDIELSLAALYERVSFDDHP